MKKLGRIVENISEIYDNISMLEEYLSGKRGEIFRKEALKKIGKGTNFVSYIVEGEYRFAPSRFVGYLNNNFEVHLEKGNGKDGKDTSPQIDKILKEKRSYSDKFEKLYLEYCNQIGASPKNMINTQRKYWIKTNDAIHSIYNIQDFEEGTLKERKHFYRERNLSLISQLKNLKSIDLSCEVCGFNFEKVYGDIGIGYIEAHHTIPISEMSDGHKTKLSDMVILCSNCHRMIHSKRPCYTVDEIKRKIAK